MCAATGSKDGAGPATSFCSTSRGSAPSICGGTYDAHVSGCSPVFSVGTGLVSGGAQCARSMRGTGDTRRVRCRVRRAGSALGDSMFFAPRSDSRACCASGMCLRASRTSDCRLGILFRWASFVHCVDGLAPVSPPVCGGVCTLRTVPCFGLAALRAVRNCAAMRRASRSFDFLSI